MFVLEKEGLPKISMGASRETGIVAGERGYIEDRHKDNLFNAKVLLAFTCLFTYAYTTSYLLVRDLVDFYLESQTGSFVSLRS